MKKAVILFFFVILSPVSIVLAQDVKKIPPLEISEEDILEDTTTLPIDSLYPTPQSLTKVKPVKPLKISTFSPDPMKAVWFSALCPGAGQIYNRRFWKLPIVIGGYMGLAYGYSWNNRYYKDYTTAYLDIMDNDPTTKSYMDFLPSTWTEENVDRDWLKDVLKRRKDFYRRNRDLCIISMIGVYLVCMVDAYVDAQLFHFDISPNIALQLSPAVIEPMRNDSFTLGMHCAINF